MHNSFLLDLQRQNNRLVTSKMTVNDSHEESFKIPSTPSSGECLGDIFGNPLWDWKDASQNPLN